MGRAEEGVGERQLEHLPVAGLGELFAAVAKIRRPQAGHAVENALALAVPEIRSVAADDDAHSAGAERLVIAERVKMVKSVELLQLCGLILIRHLKNLRQSR